AVITTGVTAGTGRVVTGKVAIVAPGRTMAVVGTTAALGLLLESVSTTPPAPAGCDRVTWPNANTPPGTGLGNTVSAAAGPVAAPGRSYSTMKPRPPYESPAYQAAISFQVPSLCISSRFSSPW